jgi:hypothetical protein
MINVSVSRREKIETHFPDATTLDLTTLVLTTLGITDRTLLDSLWELPPIVPAYYFGQFVIAPQLVRFNVSYGRVVGPKLLATSWAQTQD